MRLFCAMLVSAALLGLAALAGAQPPGGERKGGFGKGKGEGPDGPPAAGDAKAFVERMMAFDKNKDGKLTRDEITDERLLRLFDRADTNKDGVVTKEELEALFAKEMQRGGGGRGKDGPGGGPGGPGGGPGGPGGRGPGGRGGFGGPPPIGQVLPPFVQDQLQVTEAQKKQLADLQKEVDDKLAKILTAEQKKQLDEIKDRGPGGRGFGPPGGPGGFGPPGGGPGGPPKKD